ncbi:MAG: Diguanylate cyclase [Actinomycetota bacterium]|nr:Diguanylate cyclase [Actinomycetota bacterium]
MTDVTWPLLLSYVGIATALVTAVFAWRLAPGGESLGLWVLAALLGAVSPIADNLRLVISPAWVLALGTVATILAEVVAYAATRQLCGRSHTPRIYVAMCIVGCGSFIWFSLVRPLFLPRAMILSATLAVVAAAIAWVFLRAREPGLTVVFRISGGFFALYSLGQVVRFLWLPGSGIPQDTIWAPGAAVLNQLLSLPVLLMLSLMLVLVTVRRMSAAAAQERDIAAEERDIAEETSAALLADSWSDPLTGLASRARIRSVLKSSLASGPRDGLGTAVVVAVLDGNPVESHGHRVADEALVELAQRVRSFAGVGPQDWDTAGRWGENSIIMLPPVGPGSPVQDWARTLQAALLALDTPSGYTASASVAVVDAAPGTSVPVLDQALRDTVVRARDDGPAGIAFCDAGPPVRPLA